MSAETSSHADDAPLAGVVVIERAQGVAAAYTGRTLALMGADVIKIERPGSGDALRGDGPPLDQQFNVGPMFGYLNVNKSGVTLDLATVQGRKLLDEMLAKAEMFIDDTHPSERAAAGIAPDELCKKHPHLVYVSVLPYGAMGAHSDYRGYELNEFHSGGEGYLLPNGLAIEMFPERPPVKIYGHFAELNGGTSAVSAAIAALLVQPDVGGQFVDVSVQDANVAISCFALQRLGEGVLEHRHARSFQYGGVLECSDGYVQLLTLEQHQWEGLVKLMNDPAWALEPALNDPLVRARRGPEINKHIRAWAKTQKFEDVVKRGQELSVPLAKYAEPAELLASAQTRERAMFANVDLPGLGPTPVLMAPNQFSLPKSLRGCPAKPGADNTRVLGEWLGHSAAEIEQWSCAGAV